MKKLFSVTLQKSDGTMVNCNVIATAAYGTAAAAVEKAKAFIADEAANMISIATLGRVDVE